MLLQLYKFVTNRKEAVRKNQGQIESGQVTHDRALEPPFHDNGNQQPNTHQGGGKKTDDTDQRNTEKKRRDFGDDDQRGTDKQRGDNDRERNSIADLGVCRQHFGNV